MLFEKLTADEQKIISILRENYAGTDSDFFSGSFVDNQTFLRFWEEAKTPMIEAFGDRLIVKKPLNAMIEDDDLYSKMRRAVFVKADFAEFRDTLLAYLADVNGGNWDNYSLKTEGNSAQSLYEQVQYHLFTIEEWVSNRYDGLTCEIKIGDGNVLKLAHGCKVMKVLGRMAKACGERTATLFETLRLIQSQVLNEARINANLCISIHPLDFMTASFNNNDWRSCMCWEDGEYRRGVIEMMNSPMVVVAYLESKSSTMNWWNGPDKPELEWNSKRWREFFIVRPDMISGIKGYPYWNRTLEDEVINWLAEMFAPLFNTKYAPIVEWRTDRPIRDAKNDIDTVLCMDCGPAMYNDFYSDNDYHTRLAVGLHGVDEGSYYDYDDHCRKTRFMTSVFYSGASQCIVCGEPDQSFDGEGELACCDCVEHICCAKCGDAIYDRHEVYEVNGLTYCRYCYEQLDSCDACGATIDTDNDEDTLKFVVGYYDHGDNYSRVECGTDILHIAPEHEDESYTDSELYVRSVCKDCAKEIFKNGVDELYKPHDDYREWYHYYTVVPLNRLTDEGIAKLFDPHDIEYFKAIHGAETLSA